MNLFDVSNALPNTHGVMAKVLDCSLEISEFELQSIYYVPFRTNTLGKNIKLLYTPNSVLNGITAVLSEVML